VQMPAEAIDWPNKDSLRTAGVSAFGFNGSNAHVIIQQLSVEASEIEASKTEHSELAPQVLPLSAQTPAALTQLVARYAQYLAANPEVELADICYTASVGRSHFSHRLAILSTSTADLRKILIDALSGRSNPHCWKGDGTKADSDLTEITTAEGLAQAYAKGTDISWAETYADTNHRKISLPTYPFQRQYHGPDLM